MANVPVEGSTRTIKQVYTRHECDCGQPATKRHSYLLPNARRNPASKGYGGDDISWCADDERFTCDTCREPYVDGMSWCGTFSGDRFKHMLFFWHQISAEITHPVSDEDAA